MNRVKHKGPSGLVYKHGETSDRHQLDMKGRRRNNYIPETAPVWIVATRFCHYPPVLVVSALRDRRFTSSHVSSPSTILFPVSSPF
jgi:hypothetical protein